MALHPLSAQAVLPAHNRDGSMEQRRKLVREGVALAPGGPDGKQPQERTTRAGKGWGEGHIRAQHLRGCQKHVVIKINDSLMQF